MANIKFTPNRILRFKYNPDGSKIQRVWDSEILGLGIELFLSGRKSWVFRYHLLGKQKDYDHCGGCRSLPGKSKHFHTAMTGTYRKYLQPVVGFSPVQTIQRTQIRGLVDSLIEQGKEGAARALIRWCLLTGCRRDEVRTTKYSWIGEDNEGG